MSSEAGVETVTDWRERGPHPLEFGVDGLMQIWCFSGFRFCRMDEEKGKLRGVGTCIGEGGIGGSCYRY